MQNVIADPFPHVMMRSGHVAVQSPTAMAAPGLNQAQRMRYVITSSAVGQMFPCSGIQCFGEDMVKGAHLCVQCGW